MRWTVICVIAAVLGGAHCAAAAPKVAAIYSSWAGYQYRDEFDEPIKALGWQYDKVENTRIADIAGRLADYDMVVVNTTGNYEHTQDMAQYQQQWFSYLNQGGILLVLDGNYDSVLDRWVNRLGPEYALTSRQCAPGHAQPLASDHPSFDTRSRLLTFPNNLASDLGAKSTWAHIDSHQAGWTSVASCVEGKSQFMYRRVGKGMLLVTSYAVFTQAEGQRMGRHLLENVLVFAHSSAAGVDTVAVQFPAAKPGAQKGYLQVRNTGHTACCVRVQPHADRADAVRAIPSPQARIAAGQVARIPLGIDYKARGSVALTWDVLVDDQTCFSLTNQAVVPEVLSFGLPQRHQFGASTVAFTANLAPDAPIATGACTLRVSIDGRDAASIGAPKPTQRVPLNVAKLAYGQHFAQARLMYRGKTLAEQKAVFVLNPVPRVYCRQDGTMMVNGKPEFPIGWYHEPWGCTLQRKLDFLRAIGKAGFNLAHVSCDNVGEWKTVLDEADALGIKVISEKAGDLSEMVLAYKNHPAVLAWDPGDEPDGQGVAPTEMLRRIDHYKDLDYNHPSYMVLCVPSTYARYAAYSDIISPDVYPIPGGKIGDVYRNLSAARVQAARHQRALWAVVQCFGYPGENSWRVPTVSECRNMTLQALAAGAKGILYYTFDDGKFAVLKYPELWQGMRAVLEEVNAYRPFLLAGSPTSVATGTPDLVCAHWRSANEHLLLLVNTGSQQAAKVDVKPPAPAHGGSRARITGDAQGLSIQAGRVVGTLAPLGAAIVKY